MAFLIRLSSDFNFSIWLISFLSKFKENENVLNGLEISSKIIRNYPYKNVASHVIGYTQPITDSEFNILSKRGYKLNDLIGRTGIEFAYEDHIHSLHRCEGLHPQVMQRRVAAMNWAFSFDPSQNRWTCKERLKSWAKKVGINPNYANYKLLRR